MKWKFAYNKLNDHGFILIEQLISLIIVGILSIIILVLFQTIVVFYDSDNTLTVQEVNTLTVRLQLESQRAATISVGDGSVHLHPHVGQNVVSYVVRNNRLIRQVNNAGGEILSYHVSHLSAVGHDLSRATMSITSTSGDVFDIYLFTLNERQ